MRDRFRFYSDPGHGWLAVKLSELRELGVENKISGYSYIKGGTVYLEEDCDAGIFLKAYEDRYKRRVYFNEIVHDKTPIRSYRSYGNCVVG